MYVCVCMCARACVYVCICLCMRLPERRTNCICASCRVCTFCVCVYVWMVHCTMLQRQRQSLKTHTLRTLVACHWRNGLNHTTHCTAPRTANHTTCDTAGGSICVSSPKAFPGGVSKIYGPSNRSRVERRCLRFVFFACVCDVVLLDRECCVIVRTHSMRMLCRWVCGVHYACTWRVVRCGE